jgi:hypothetical protein
MFLFAVTALAAANNFGWPCQRLNWGWRNVWSTCSINSFSPTAGAAETSNTIPTHFRYTTAPITPTTAVASTGVFTPVSSALPNLLCLWAPNTGSGITSNLRNRCRRAIDAYGALVKACQLPAATAIRFPNAVSPDHLPYAGHLPHVTNVNGLTHNAQMCLLPAGAYVPANLHTPSTQCPGLLGWFTVVFNACGFTHAPGFSPAQMPNTGYTPKYFLPSGLSSDVLPGAPTAQRNGFFCANAAAGPDAYNPVGAVFRTSRCRKALDQFGRTASRCHMSAAPHTGPAQAGGYSDPLRYLAVGFVADRAPAAPVGLNVLAPFCNLA